VKQQQFNCAYLFGAVCPSTRATEAIIDLHVDMKIMREHLSLISKRTQTGRYGVIIVDGAAWHQLYLAEEFANFSIIKLPPYSSELNPIELVWQWLRQNGLANRCYDGYDDIVEQYCRAWNSFISDNQRLVSLCTRDWIDVGS
jgi:hypothetical protein